MEVLGRVCVSEELHAQHSEDVDHNNEQKGEVSQGTQGGDDYAEEDLHRCPRLSKFQYSHLDWGRKTSHTMVMLST